MSACYSNRPLAKKLGIRQGQKIALLNQPHGYNLLLGELPDGVTITHEFKGELDLVQLFAKDAETLEREFRASKEKIKQDGMIWACWPKASSKVRRDLNENQVRKIGLRNGLVDEKICAVDQTWSALKFVIRVKDRR